MSNAQNTHNSATPAWRLLIATVVILCAVYFPIWLGYIVFTSDVAHWMFPARWFVRDSLLHGELPGWNPSQGIGFAIFANPLHGVFYPPNWLTLLVPSGWLASLLTWLDFAHLVWGGVGMFLLARRLARSSVAACVAALIWSLAGYNTSQWTAGLRMVAGAWVPWVAVGWLALYDSLNADRRAWPLGLVKAALPTAFGLLVGEIFVAMMGVGFALATVAASALSVRRDQAAPRLSAGRLSLFVLAPVLATGIGAITLVPACALRGSTERAARLSRAEAEASSLHPARLVELVAPNSTGPSAGFPLAAQWIADPGPDKTPLSRSLYLGASALALALMAFGRGRRLALILGALAGFSLVLALGKYLPVHAVFRQVVFPFAYMRFPEKYAVLLVGWVALLAALGATRILVACGAAELCPARTIAGRHGNPPRVSISEPQAQPWRRVAVLLGLLLILAACARWFFPGRWAEQVARGALCGCVAVAGVLAAQLLAAWRQRLSPVVLIAVVATDLAAATWPGQSFAPRQIAQVSAAATRAVLADSGSHGEPPRLYRAHDVLKYLNRFVLPPPPGWGELQFLQTFITNTANNWGIATLPGYDAAIPAKLDQIWGSGLQQGQSILRLLGARYAVLAVENPQAADVRSGLEPMLDPLPGTRLYRVPGALPRVFLVGEAEVWDDAHALRRILNPAVVSGSTVLLAPGSGAQPLLGAPDSPPGTCALDSYSRNRLQAHCQVQRPALAVFVEQFEKGWRATVDGQPAPILRANLIMRALALGPGRHTIAMEYSTPGLRAGAMVSLLCLAAILGLAIGARLSRRG